jgi:hypothetical protein
MTLEGRRASDGVASAERGEDGPEHANDGEHPAIEADPCRLRRRRGTQRRMLDGISTECSRATAPVV